jgi:hypothetical protein
MNGTYAGILAAVITYVALCGHAVGPQDEKYILFLLLLQVCNESRRPNLINTP